MSLSLVEWGQLQALVLAYWPHAKPVTDEVLEVQHELVCRLDREMVAEAIREHAVSGAEFPPGPGQLVARVHAWPMTTRQIMEAQELAEQRKAERLAKLGLGASVDGRGELPA